MAVIRLINLNETSKKVFNNIFVRSSRALIFALMVGGLSFGHTSASAQEGPDVSGISVPPGFSIEVWSDAVPNARSMAIMVRYLSLLAATVGFMR